MTLRRRFVDAFFAAMLLAIPALVLRANLNATQPSAVDRAFLRVTAPLQASVSWAISGVGSLWSRYVALVDVERENRELRAENELLRRELAVMAQRAFTVDALEQVAALKAQIPADTIGAHVIAAPLSPQFRVLRLRIDRGEHEVQPGMPVITANGPVGRISRVYGSYADVVLISDVASKVEIVIPRTGGRGIISGKGEADSYSCKVEWLERSNKADARVEVGDVVVTSGLGATFPQGLVIGHVSRVGADDGMWQELDVEPSVDVSKVRAVLVLLAPPPPPDPSATTKRRSEPAFGTRAM